MRRRQLLSAGLIFFAFFTGTLCLFILSLGPPGQALFAISSSGLHINNNFNWRQFRFNPDRNMYVRRREENTRAYLDFYYKEPMVAFNPYIQGKPQDGEHQGKSQSSTKSTLEPYTDPIPAFSDVKARLPTPFWEGHQEAIDCYWSTWEIAFRNIKPAGTETGFVSNFIDTAFNNCLFMWDSAFILLFARYGSRAFDFQRTLDNFYAKQHPDGFISREIHQWDGQDQFHRHDPTSTGPNVLPWEEWEYFQNFGDVQRIKNIFFPLLGYHRWMRKHRTWPDGTYWTCGLGCGMDNQPRIPEGCNAWVDHGHMAWIDACAHAVLSAKVLLDMHQVVRDSGAKESEWEVDLSDLREEVEQLTKFINDAMWDDTVGFYHDRRLSRLTGQEKGKREGLSEVKTIGAYWTLLAGVVPQERLATFVGHLDNPAEFKTPHRVPALSRDHPKFAENGDYWNGGVWAPTNYMVLRGLTKNGQDELAYEIAANHHRAVVDVHQQTGTVWENYSPSSAAPGSPAKKDFVGWSGLGPIAIFLEYVIGLRPYVEKGLLVWDVRQLEAHGVTQYPFGRDGWLDLSCEARTSAASRPQVTVKSSVPLKLELRWNHAGDDSVQVALIDIQPYAN